MTIQARQGNIEIQELEVKIDEHDRQIEAILANESLSDEQRTEHDSLVRKRDLLASKRTQEVRKLERAGRGLRGINAKTTADEPLDCPTYRSSNENHRPASVWIDNRGARVRSFGKGESISAALRQSREERSGQPEEPLSLGRAIVGLVTGDRERAPREMMAMGTNGFGHHLVPEQLSSLVLDLARARSVCFSAGAQTIEMLSDHLMIAKVESDPTFAVKTENERFDESQVTFGMKTFTARTIGTIITISRELAQDAPNASEIIEHCLSAALAVELDRLQLEGTGSEEMMGLATAAGVGESSGVGAIAWEDLAAAVVGIKTNNGAPNAWVANPVIAGDLDALTTGDGVNSAKIWLPPPPSVAKLERYETTAAPTSSLYIGDFSQMVFAVRMAAELDISPYAGEAFERNQVKIRMVWRGDIGLLRPSHFHRLVGITT